ncbi:MAG: Asparaginyl-tRNA synthetase [Myxococcales bacterium]|nr:Asparaginyl-tRNA synthetase [Myxococcales bacterium]
MAPHVYVEDLKHHVGQEVTLKGWLYNMAGKGKLYFLQIRDGSGIVQAVVSKQEVAEDVFARVGTLKQETSVIVTGTVREDKRSTLGVEVGLKDLQILQLPTADFPISPKDHGTAFLMSQRHLWLRSKRQVAVLRVRHEIIKQIRHYFDSHGFTLMDAPIFTPNAVEGTTTLFPVKYFDDTAFLTQSGQLYGEAGAMALGRIYTFGPTFRAEKSKTRRHLTEFWMVEPEVAFMDLAGDMDLAEDFLVSVVQGVLANRRPELEILERDIAKLERVQKPFPRIRYEEAIEILKKKGKETKFGDDFGADEETAISEEFDRPIMIHRYPAVIKSFYMKRDPEDARLALALDVIAPEGYGEIIGGSQREDDLAVLESRIAEHNLPKEPFEWYLDLRRYGSVPHAGFGLGVERTVQWICGLHHVRETIPFPRLMGKIEP